MCWDNRYQVVDSFVVSDNLLKEHPAVDNFRCFFFLLLPKIVFVVAEALLKWYATHEARVAVISRGELPGATRLPSPQPTEHLLFTIEPDLDTSDS